MASDFELLEAWKAGDDASGNLLVRRHFERIYMFFDSKVGGAVEDLTQRTFLACTTARDRIDPQRSFRTYLYGIARNQLLQYYTRLRRDSERDDLWQTPLDFARRGGDCEDFAIAKYFVLRLLGFPAADLRIAVLTGVETNEVHSVLLARLAGEWQVLDNREEQPRPLRRYDGWIPQYAVSESAGFRYSAAENAAAGPYRPAQR